MVKATILYVLDSEKKKCGYLDRLQDSVICIVFISMLQFIVYQDLLLYGQFILLWIDLNNRTSSYFSE